MTKQRSLNQSVLSMAATVSVFLLTASFAPSTQAAVIEAYKTSSTTPIVVAWTGHRERVWERRHGYYGNRHYHRCHWVNHIKQCW